MTAPARAIPPFAAPLWSSAFRPFYLLGSLYALLFVAAWLGAYLGLWRAPAIGVGGGLGAVDRDQHVAHA